MPTVLTFKGWRIVIYTNDHRPPHAHVLNGNDHARFELLCDLKRVKVLSNSGLKQSQLNQLAAYLTEHVTELCKVWGNIYGNTH
jgi:hypothetical protein